MKTFQLLRCILPVLVLTVLPSCSSEFRSAWKNSPAPKGVDGKWEGTWHSDATGHQGKLKCVVKYDPDEQPYTCGAGVPLNSFMRTFLYHATWMKILSGSYKAIHNVQKQKDGTYKFTGEHKMPDWAGGLYHYEGTIKGDEFKANYKCAMDHGTYTMKRAK